MVKSTTCGGKSKEFKWDIINNQVVIYREFKSGSNKITLPLSCFEKLNTYLQLHNSISLGNSVTKLKDGTEKNGIGTFLMHNYNLNSSEAQVASQVSAILCVSSVWKTNGKLRNIEFYSISDICTDKITTYYKNNSNK